MVIALNPKGFKLPRVEKEKFLLLIRLGLDYNRERDYFQLKTTITLKNSSKPSAEF